DQLYGRRSVHCHHRLRRQPRREGRQQQSDSHHQGHAMSKRHTSRQVIRHGVGPARSSSGFTLIELMVAMVLGLIVVAGVASVCLANQRTDRTNQAPGDVPDGSRLAFEMMARDIREAGLTGCNNRGRVANVLNNTSTPWWAGWGNAAHGYGAGTA